MTRCWWKPKRMTFGSVASTCARASVECSRPSMPMQYLVLPRTCWVRSHLQEDACHHSLPPISPSDCEFLSLPPREQAEPLLGGPLRCAVPGLRGGTMSPGQWHPVCSHAKGQCGASGRHRLEAHLNVTLVLQGGTAPEWPQALKGDVIYRAGSQA